MALQEFLHARNPKNQHSGTLESYLIKPIQVNVLALQENNVASSGLCKIFTDMILYNN